MPRPSRRCASRAPGIRKLDDRAFAIEGDLTIKDQTHPVVLDAELLGTVTGMQGGRVTAVSAQTKISRKDWGLTWNVALESGGWLVGDEIGIHMEFELVAPVVAQPTERATGHGQILCPGVRAPCPRE